MNQVSGNITLQAIFNGTTLAPTLQVAGLYPLKQTYNKDAGTVTPDYPTVWSNSNTRANCVTLFPLVIRTEDATPLSIQTVEFTYNGVKVASTSAGATTPIIESAYTSLFEGIEYTYVYGSDNKELKLPAIRIKGNLANANSNTDNDVFGCSGTANVYATEIAPFICNPKDFIIADAGGSKYTLWLTAQNAGQITEDMQEIKVTAHTDINGNLLEEENEFDDTKYKIDWYILTTTTTHITSSSKLESNTQVLKVGADDINGMCTVLAKLIDKNSSNSKVLATSTIDLLDLSDPLEIKFNVADKNNDGKVTGFQIQRGGEANVSASVVKRGTGENDSNTWHFSLVCRNHTTGKIVNSPAPTKQMPMVVTYAQVMAADRALAVYATASLKSSIADRFNRAAIESISSGKYELPDNLYEYVRANVSDAEPFTLKWGSTEVSVTQ